MGIDISPAQRSAYYRAALVGLHALDAVERTPRRFGPDADARWAGFAGHLGLAERLDLLIRDAAVTWGVAFSPALIFHLPGLAADEPFGPDWAPLPEHEAKTLWAAPPAEPSMSAVAQALDIAPGTVDLPAITPTTRLFVAGGAAVLAVAAHFAAQHHLSWPHQVLVVAEGPRTLQLAGLIAPVTGAGGPTRARRPTDHVASALQETGWTPGGQAVVSHDATPYEAFFTRQAAGEG